MYIHSIDTEIDMIHTDMCIDVLVDVRCAHRINITVLKLFRILYIAYRLAILKNHAENLTSFKIQNRVFHIVMATDITDGYNPWIFCNPSSVVNFFGKMEKRRCRRHL